MAEQQGGERNDEIVEFLARASGTAGSIDRQRLQVPGGSEAPSSPTRPRYQKQSNVMSKIPWYRQKPDVKTIIGIIILVVILIVALVVSYLTRPQPPPPLLIKSTSPNTITYRFASVAADAGICSEFGTSVLARGGSAVDAALTAHICAGVVHMQSAGIGGGFHMVIWDATQRAAYTLDARETAPRGWTEDRLNEQSGSIARGPFSIAIPGEVAGLWAAHQRFGRLPWYSLFKPSIDMCRNGFKVTGALSEAFNGFTIKFLTRYSESFYEKIRKFFINPATGNLYQTGDTIRCPELANTLERIAVNGSAEFYNGSLADDVIADLADYHAPIAKVDLEEYHVVWRKPLVNEFKNGLKMYSMRPPGNGAVLAYMLNILQAFNFAPADIEQPLTYHRFIEATKFAAAKGIHLGDEDFAPDKAELEKLLAEMTSPTMGQKTRLWINDSSTHEMTFYEPSTFDKPKDFGTGQTSVLTADGSAVSLTSSINMIFGSGLVGRRTGIVFNNEMDDFFTSSKLNSAGNPPPTSANFVQPGKRPLSSSSPAVFVVNNSATADRSVRLVLGAAGGGRITSATAQVAARVLLFGENIKQAIEAPRFHHQRSPEKLIYESMAPQGLLKYLRDRGHTNLELSSISLRTVVQGVQRLENGSIIGISDARKAGLYADGF